MTKKKNKNSQKERRRHTVIAEKDQGAEEGLDDLLGRVEEPLEGREDRGDPIVIHNRPLIVI
jgi:formylglycine-generating enzyme required for sulfatase activity